jgi:tRNA threonylcarbamoyladenosine biosynthesis protein TsaE
MAARLASCLISPLVLTFNGDIGAGKTTLIRAMLRSLGVTSAIKSPTFSLVESYQTSNFHIHHFDLYRIHDETELEYVGFRDYFEDNAICCIEWPDRAKSYRSMADIDFTLDLKGNGREMQIQALSSVGQTVLSCLAGPA